MFRGFHRRLGLDECRQGLCRARPLQYPPRREGDFGSLTISLYNKALHDWRPNVARVVGVLVLIRVMPAGNAGGGEPPLDLTLDPHTPRGQCYM